MKTLAGSWQGTIMGISINFTIRAASSGTAILHEGHTDGGGPPNQEITMFYVEGDRLLATHFCDAGNRSRLEGPRETADGEEKRAAKRDDDVIDTDKALTGCVYAMIKPLSDRERLDLRYREIYESIRRGAAVS